MDVGLCRFVPVTFVASCAVAEMLSECQSGTSTWTIFTVFFLAPGRCKFAGEGHFFVFARRGLCVCTRLHMDETWVSLRPHSGTFFGDFVCVVRRIIIAAAASPPE